MKVGDLVKWTGREDLGGCTIGLVELVCDTYIYVRWADGILDEYRIDEIHQ
jgi:hypothetical protein